MDPKEFLRTVYLGDCGCKSILIDSWNDRVIIQATNISRIKTETETWDYNSEKDIPDGLLVFTGLTSISITPLGIIPNDLINAIEVEMISSVGGTLSTQPLYLFKLFVDSVNHHGQHTEAQIEITAEDVHLEDPRQLGIPIRD
jgi:alpha-L-arabinofuranosidase